MKIDFNTVQTAFVEGFITLDEFIQILIDNFGKKKARKILRKNLDIAIKKEEISKSCLL